jgi:hypothetical protein
MTADGITDALKKKSLSDKKNIFDHYDIVFLTLLNVRKGQFLTIHMVSHLSK